MGWELNMHIFPDPLRGLQHRKGPKRGSQGSTQLLCLFLLHLPLSTFYTPLLCLLSSTCCYRYFYHIHFFQCLFTVASLNPYFWSNSVSLTLAAFVSVPPSFHECSWHRFPCSSWAKITDYREREALHSQRTQIYPTNCGAWQPNPVYWKREHKPMQRAHVVLHQQRFSSFLSWLRILSWTYHNLTCTTDVKAFKANMDNHQ